MGGAQCTYGGGGVRSGEELGLEKCLFTHYLISLPEVNSHLAESWYVKAATNLYFFPQLLTVADVFCM